MTSNDSRGFTLIELMITVTIVAILASIALPAYQNYSQRAKVGAAMGGARAIKLAITDCQSDFGSFEKCDSGAPGTNIPTSTEMKKIAQVKQGSVVNGVISITTEAINRGGDHMHLRLSPQLHGLNIDWRLTGNGCKHIDVSRGIFCQ